MTPSRVLLRLIALGAIFGVAVARAQLESPVTGVAVKIYTLGFGSSGDVSASGTFLASSPTASDAYAAATVGVNLWGYAAAVLGSGGYVRVEPGKSYTVSVGGTDTTNRELNVIAPSGYYVVMDHIRRTRMTYSDFANIVIQLIPLHARHPGLAGMASAVTSSEIDWSISLGSLRNGNSAGDLELVDTGMRSDWSPIFTPAMLNYESTASEVSVYRVSNVIRQIIANQVVIDVVTLSSTSYKIDCYHPSQMSGTTDPRTFTGEPYVSYKIEQGATATTLKFTKEVHNVTASNQTPGVARREIMTLARSGSWPTFSWLKQDWTVENATALAETAVSTTGTATDRTDTISVRDVGSSTPALKVARHFQTQTNIGEVVADESAGTSLGVTSTFTYYNDTSDWGSLGFVKTATMPGGGWVAFDYMAADLFNGYRGGQVQRRYRPFMDAPATAASDSSGEMTVYSYARDVFGASTRPNETYVYLQGTTNVYVSRTSWFYDDTSLGGFSQTTRRDYTDETHYQTSIALHYRADNSDAFFRGQPYAITQPDGAKQAFGYQRGTWDGTAFTTTGTTASRVTVVTGSKYADAGSACPNLGSAVFDTIYLVDGKSTREDTIRDARALVVRKESYIWKNQAWQFVSGTTFTYDYAGRLTNSVASNGATYTATYDGGLKTSETDDTGVVTNYTYDVHGRVLTLTRTGVSNSTGTIAAVTTRFTYDASGKMTKQEVGYGGSEVLTTQYGFDDAGRPVSLTPPGNYAAETYAYDTAARKKTTTRGDGSATITVAYRDTTPASTTGSGVVASYTTYGRETDGRRWTQVNVGTSSSARWHKTWTDWIGRKVKEQTPNFTGQADLVNQFYYGTTERDTGLLIKSTSSGVTVPTLYEHDYLGQVSRSGLDYNNNGVLDLSTSDRISESETYLESYNGAWWLRTETRGYLQQDFSIPVTTAISRTRLTGHPTNRRSETQAIDAEGNVTTQTVDVDPTNRISTTTTTRTGIANAQVETALNGLSVKVQGYDQLTTAMTYDALSRRSTVATARNTDTTVYLSGTALVWKVTNSANFTTQYAYDAMGRVNLTRDPRNAYTHASYNARGQLWRQWGSGTMPVEYGYDETYGNRTTMSTFRGGTNWAEPYPNPGSTLYDWPGTGNNTSGSTGTADVTTWTYDGPSGLLQKKTDAKNKFVAFAYNARGQTLTRTFARGAVTTYGYDNATGELLTQTYSDSTPSVTYTYGRSGQIESVADFTGYRDLVYDSNKPWRMTAEAESSFYGGRYQTRLYDESNVVGRVRGLQVGLTAGSSSDLEQTFGFTSVGRFETLTSKFAANTASRTFRYAYRTDSALLDSLAIDQGAGPGGHPFTISRTYEANRDLVTSIEAKWSTTSLTKYAYDYDERGQRKDVVQSGSAFSDYGDATFRLFSYDGRGEVTQDIAYLGSDVSGQTQPLPGRRHEFDYDQAQNRKWSDRNGNATLRDNYTVNELNQYTQRENNTVAVSGTAELESTPAGGAGGTAVSIAGGSLTPVAAGRQGRYWGNEIAVGNTLAPWRGVLTIFAAKRGTAGSPDLYKIDSRLVEVAAQTQAYQYDDDGNLTGDSMVDYTWDAENRLVRMETKSALYTAGFPHRILEFRYDYLGRRVQKRVLDADPSPAVEIFCRRYLYDGWNMIAEYQAPGGTSLGALERTYTWGLDIATDLQKAGGVGALLQIADLPTGKTYLPAYDGNGNIVSLVNAATGALAATYEYGPFGETLRAQANDPTVVDNPWRFSSKFTDTETGLVYYGLRYYSPSQGRFLGRDTKEEKGGRNLYAFCLNNVINGWDYLGMEPRFMVINEKGEWEDGDGLVTEGGIISTSVFGKYGTGGGWGANWGIPGVPLSLDPMAIFRRDPQAPIIVTAPKVTGPVLNEAVASRLRDDPVLGGIYDTTDFYDADLKDEKGKNNRSVLAAYVRGTSSIIVLNSNADIHGIINELGYRGSVDDLSTITIAHELFHAMHQANPNLIPSGYTGVQAEALARKQADDWARANGITPLYGGLSSIYDYTGVVEDENRKALANGQPPTYSTAPWTPALPLTITDPSQINVGNGSTVLPITKPPSD